MSSNTSASHAAALAAFKSLNKTEESPSHTFKVPKPTSSKNDQSSIKNKIKPSRPKVSRIDTSVNESSSAARSVIQRNSIGQHQPQTPKCTVIAQSPLASISNEKGGGKQEISTEGSPSNMRENYSPALQGMGVQRKSSKPANSYSKTNAQEVIRNVRNSIDSKSIMNDMKTKRLSSSYEPQEMINSVKSSINAYKLGDSSSQELAEKSRKAINDVKESINSKQKLSIISTPELLSSMSDTSMNQNTIDSSASIKDSFRATKHSIHNESINNNSYSSLGSAYSETYPETPIIVIDKNLDKEDRRREELDFNNNKIIDRISDADKSNGDVSRIFKNSVMTPPSVSQVFSKDGLTGSESGSKDSLNDQSSGKDFDTYSLNKTVSMEYSKLKPNRKPPPDLMSSSSGIDSYNGNDEYLDSHSIASSGTGWDSRMGSRYDVLSKQSSQVNTDTYSNYSNDDYFQSMAKRDSYPGASQITPTELPRFPDLDDKKKHSKKNHENKSKTIFKIPRKSKGVDESVNFLQSDDEDEEYKVAVVGFHSNRDQPSTPLGPQPVRLKTTMRKNNKRKDKKLQFNENKPWKNHYDLDSISEQERKRYEGVWASNKGLYMNCVVTRLLGVNYDTDSSAKEKDSDQEEASRRAARLSAHQRFSDDNTTDKSNFHNLVSAEIDQLMHGVVVKRLWKRSRLPNETLAAIWNLVDFRKDGSLNKSEFVVGMWLVDQCLYGRKLPKKVEDFIWDSLGGIGVSVVIKKKGKR